MKKKSHSMVRQVVLIPMTVMLFILLITIGVCGFTVINMQHQMVDSYESAAKVTLNRVDVRLTQIETAFVNYWIYDSNHANLRVLPSDMPREEYLKFQTGTVSWMKRTADIFSEIEGLIVYYRNLDLLQFQGKANLCHSICARRHCFVEEGGTLKFIHKKQKIWHCQVVCKMIK